MIVSHKHKFIFLKTYKTAGSSMEVLFSRFCGPDDIVTPLMPEDEALRPDHGPRNYKWPWWQWPLRGKIKSLKGKNPGVRWTGYYAHMPARPMRRYLGEDVWNSYFKFSIERNPWDRQVSIYFWRTRNLEKRPSFKEYMHSNDNRVRLRNFDIYSLGGKIIADDMIMFHDMRADLERIFGRLGLDMPEDIPGAKTGVRTERGYREHYDDETREMVARWYKREIEVFGFEF